MAAPLRQLLLSAAASTTVTGKMRNPDLEKVRGSAAVPARATLTTSHVFWRRPANMKTAIATARVRNRAVMLGSANVALTRPSIAGSGRHSDRPV